MAVQLRVMSWNIEKKATTAAYIAELMRVHQIDVLAMLEVPNGNAGIILANIVAALDNLAVAYHQNEWFSQAVDVGDEAVGYVWHQNNAVSANAFQVDLKANGVQRVFGPVTRNTANARIYFPKTQTSWASLPGTPDGRRPAYLSFVTNDGAAARRFTVLDLHTPFPTGTSIQSYSTSLIATSREITHVDRTDLPAIAAAAVAAGGGLAAVLAGTADPVLAGMTNNFVVAATLRTDAVAGAQAAIDGDEIDLALLSLKAGRAGARGALTNVTIPANVTRGDASLLATAAAMAGVGAAATMAASAQLPTAPGPATGNVGAARTVAIQNAFAEVSQFVFPAKRSPATLMTAIRQEAVRIAQAALTPFTFNALPLTAVDASIIAGDFNVDYPDINVYQPAYKLKMGGAANNAYTRLLALGAARNTERSTRISPTAYRGQLVYQLHNPCPIQSANGAAAGYVPLNVASLIMTPTSFLNFTSWQNGLQMLAGAQHLIWTTIVAFYELRIQGAFDHEVNNDTRYYRANCYDNMFVRGAAVTASGVIDVISELGSWAPRGAALPNPQPALAPNPWAAAAASLNGLAQAYLGGLFGPLTYVYGNVNYTITAALANACDAAVFFDRYISDHLPVYVQVQL
jgi:hypothetical protein